MGEGNAHKKLTGNITPFVLVGFQLSAAEVKMTSSCASLLGEIIDDNVFNDGFGSL